jgi:hypothetical protein
MVRPQSNKHSDASSFSLSELPVELLALILQQLNSRDLKAARLVCKNWELISRPRFARRHLCRSVFWTTGSSLRELDQLSRKFGPYMKIIYIDATRFTLSGLSRLFKKFLRDRRATFTYLSYDVAAGCKVNQSATVLDVKSHHLANCFRRHGWQHDGTRFANVRFYWHYLRNIISQHWLRISGRDLQKIAGALNRTQGCEVKLVKLKNDVGQLQINSRLYGKPAPEHAFELALYTEEEAGVDTSYSAYLIRVLAEVRKWRRTP